VRFGRRRIRSALRGEISQDQAPQERAVEVEATDGQQHGNGHAIGSAQVYFAASAAPDVHIDHAGERWSAGVRDQVQHR